jgi:23S rRNA pseudouridine1911/1915/1917 synthase
MTMARDILCSMKGTPEEIELFSQIQILHEDDSLLVINKPVGLVVHWDGRSTEPSLVEWIIDHVPGIETVGEPVESSEGAIIRRPGIVHRLDKDTSGLLLIAKTQEMHAWLKHQFLSRGVKKEYRAFVHGIIVEEAGKIDRPIGKSASDFRRFSAQRGAKGVMRDALTYYTVLKRFTTNTQNFPVWNANGYTYVALNPITGRTHQLRVHMKAVNHPVVADPFYAGVLGKGLCFENLALHAYKMSVPLPDGTTGTFEAPLREDFLRALS